jgi:hypothetical protein
MIYEGWWYGGTVICREAQEDGYLQDIYLRIGTEEARGKRKVDYS